jgi:hypothetical protein
MSNPRYIHLDSSFRNRYEFKEPHTFEVDINCPVPYVVREDPKKYVSFGAGCINDPPIPYTGSIPAPESENVVELKPVINGGNYVNPTSSAAPIYLFRVQSLSNPASPLNFSGGLESNPILNVANTVSIPDYYVGYYIIKNPTNDGGQTTPEIRMITVFEQSTRIIYMNQPFTSFNVNDDQYVLMDPTSALSIINDPGSFAGSPYASLGTAAQALAQLPLGPEPVIHLQYQDIFEVQAPFFDNEYVTYYATSIIPNESRKIKSYNKTVNIAFLEKNSPTDIGPLFLANGLANQVSISKGIPFYSTGNTYVDNIYYDTNNIVINKYFPCLNTTCPLYAMILPYVDPGVFPPTDFTDTTIDPVLLRDELNLVNYFIYKVQEVATSQICGKTYLNVCGPIPSEWYLTSQQHKVVLFYADYDSNHCVQFYGNEFPTKNPACYELEIIKLVLPNIDLITGSRIAFYPYVLVEFTNAGNTVAKSKFILESNNPNASNAEFICPIDDTTNPLVSAFTKVDGNGMTQTMKFVPNQKLRFSVFLPDGDAFQPVMLDNSPPLPPNRRIQISCSFSFRRV